MSTEQYKYLLGRGLRWSSVLFVGTGFSIVDTLYCPLTAPMWVSLQGYEVDAFQLRRRCPRLLLRPACSFLRPLSCFALTETRGYFAGEPRLGISTVAPTSSAQLFRLSEFLRFALRRYEV